MCCARHVIQHRLVGASARYACSTLRCASADDRLVEVRLSTGCSAAISTVRVAVERAIRSTMASVCCFSDVTDEIIASPSIADIAQGDIESVRVCEASGSDVPTSGIIHLGPSPIVSVNMIIYVYQLHNDYTPIRKRRRHMFTCPNISDDDNDENCCNNDSGDNDSENNVQGVSVNRDLWATNNSKNASDQNDEQGTASTTHWTLPAQCFDGLWESLVMADDIPDNLLRYMRTTMLFSDSGVNSIIVSWNRVILLHGPPGTGKTSLCKALAQKLAIRLNDRFPFARLIEINSHALFSKYFSESGKLVVRMFAQIDTYIRNKDAFLCILIDEVESLSAARKSATSGNEPSDALRVVNALLTQLDKLKQHPNVLVLTTSNITGAIDLAFVDRADVKQYIGPPSTKAIYTILASCLHELMRVGIISPKESLIDARVIESWLNFPNERARASVHLYAIAQKCTGFSGRMLRKLPFLAHATHAQQPYVSLNQFLVAVSNAVDSEHRAQYQLAEASEVPLSVQKLSLEQN